MDSGGCHQGEFGSARATTRAVAIDVVIGGSQRKGGASSVGWDVHRASCHSGVVGASDGCAVGGSQRHGGGCGLGLGDVDGDGSTPALSDGEGLNHQAKVNGIGVHALWCPSLVGTAGLQ